MQYEATPLSARFSRPRRWSRTRLPVVVPLVRRYSVARKTAHELRLYRGRRLATKRPGLEVVGSLPEMLRTFQGVTGWPLEYANSQGGRPHAATHWTTRIGPPSGPPWGELRLLSPADESGTRQSLDRSAARKLASALGGMLNELAEARDALWHREAELATAAAMTSHRCSRSQLAATLEAVLKAGAEATDCAAAALYLLDDATTHLKLRSCWGLPFDRLTAPARPLRGAIADLEAMLGHAVVLEDADSVPQWNAPEDFPSAVCLPVSTSTTLLGTLWVYCNRRRDFSARETNLLEVVAGRLAAELERESLLRDGVGLPELHSDLAAAQRLQRNQLPTLSPLLDGWQLAGWAAQSRTVGGAFYDWFCRPGGLLAFALGQASTQGLQGALTAGAVKTALRSHGQYRREAQDVLGRANLTLWTSSAGDLHAATFLALVEIATGRVSCASAGRLGAILVSADGWRSITGDTPQLGDSPETTFEPGGYELAPGELLVVFSPSLCSARDNGHAVLGLADLAEPVAANRQRSADDLVDMLRRRIAAVPAAPAGDHALLVVKRTLS